MNVLQWQPEFEIGIEAIDHQHRHLVDVTNQFGKLLFQDRVVGSELEPIFDELVSYTKYHFETEENLIAKSRLDLRHFSHHELEHQNFLHNIMLLRREVTSGQNSARNLFDFLLNWLVYHILGTDRSLGKQLNAVRSGVSAADAYQAEEHEKDLATELLLNSLDKLFSHVMERNQQLRELNQTLETKVVERTLALSEANRLLEIQASTDVLTGLSNRRRAMDLLNFCWREAQEKQLPLACILIDADHFKEVNDTYGHDAGDNVLRELAKELQHHVRTDDFVCRLGGDEFLIICPKTDREGALHIAKQVHAAVANLLLPVGAGKWQGSISVGVATKVPGMSGMEALIKAADRAVYTAKKAGKNCVRLPASV